jgi:predicted lipoprotein with Yx(FWY)xxD motif
MRRIAAAFITVLLIADVAAVAAQAASKKLTLKSEAVSSLNGNVLAAPNGRTLYRLKPETTHHVLCTTASGCLQFWKPLMVSSKKTKVNLPSGIKGKISFLARGKKFQVALKGLPLYTFTGDRATGTAVGQNIKTFGGTWLTLAVKSTSSGTGTGTPQPAPPLYPPGY